MYATLASIYTRKFLNVDFAIMTVCQRTTKCDVKIIWW